MKLNKKGFTLVELLAVIVILAVVMLVAVTAVGPAITNSKKGAFFSSASAVQDGAALYASANGITSNKCLTLDALQTSGYFNNKDKNLKGIVFITVSDNAYTYKLWLSNSDYSVTNKLITQMDDKGAGTDTTRSEFVYGTTATYVKSGSTYYKCDGSAGSTTAVTNSAANKVVTA